MGKYTSGKIEIELTGSRDNGSGIPVKTGTINAAGKTGTIDVYDLGDCVTNPSWIKKYAAKVAGSNNDLAIICQQAYNA